MTDDKFDDDVYHSIRAGLLSSSESAWLHLDTDHTTQCVMHQLKDDGFRVVKLEPANAARERLLATIDAFDVEPKRPSRLTRFGTALVFGTIGVVAVLIAALVIIALVKGLAALLHI